MRITGFSSGFSGSGPGSEERRRRFRNSHTVGQLVQGTLLRQENEDLCWVEVDGHELLAAVRLPSAGGTALTFRIMRLVPDIVLQQIQGGDAVPTLDDLARDFSQAHETLSALTRGLDLSSLPTPAQREALYLQALREDQRFWAAHMATEQHLAQVNAELAARGAGMLLSMPWLLPQALDQQIMLHNHGAPGDTGRDAQDEDGLLDATYAFTLPRVGHVRARILARKGLARFRLFMEHPEHGPMLETLIHDLSSEAWAALGDTGEFQLECMGVSPLAPGPRSLLAAYLSSPEQRLFSGLNRRV